MAEISTSNLTSLPPSVRPKDFETAVTQLHLQLRNELRMTFTTASLAPPKFQSLAPASQEARLKKGSPARHACPCASTAGRNKLADGGANLSKFCNEQEEKLASR